ncbi:hypothetical protein C8F01DRAFT_586101 [Mycena amicta]|nr:hypothetical protein C8F01DRAFT_586101 [Mycena amicta]
MYAAASPYGQQQYGQQQQQQPYSTQVAPGQITYTTSYDSSGRVVYHTFKAIAASYPSPAGVISGIQWVPAESTLTAPLGARPADAEFAAAWSRTPITKEEQKALKDWQRTEEKRRKKEEKEAKRQREKEQRMTDTAADADLRRARERDAQATTRERRKSFNQGVAAPGAQAFPANPNYPTTPYTAGYNVADLNQQFGEMDVATGMARPLRYQTDAERTRKISNNITQQAPYVAAYPAYGNPSPNMRPAETAQAASAYGNTTVTYPANYPPAAAMGRPTTPYTGSIYPPGHMMEGKPMGTTPPIPGVATSASSYTSAQAGVYPQMQMPVPDTTDQGQLPSPEGFNRPVNTALAFTPFEKMKVQDMTELVLSAPRMPVALQPHDVYPSDWARLMQDLCLAWTGKLPAPGRSNRKSTLAIDLIDLWNVSFFSPRGVEGRERRSGTQAGTEDIQLPIYDDHDDSSSSSSSSSSSDSDDDDPRYAQMYMYGQQPGQAAAEVMEQKRRRRAEKKRRRKEKKARRKAKAREKKYALYIACVASGVNGQMGMGAPPQMMHGISPGMPMNAYGGAVAGGMPMTGQPGAWGT